MSAFLRVCCLGDVIGRPGRRALHCALPLIRQDLAPDLVVVNGENAAGGRGLTKRVYGEFKDMGCDVITMGNHWKDQEEVLELLSLDHPPVILPVNMNNVEDSSQGLRWVQVKGHSIAVMNLSGVLHMPPSTSPFTALDALLAQIPPSIPLRLVDLHAEATSEKQGLAYYAAKRVSLIWGTHTHVPTADERILEDHSGYITDIGMVGGYDSVIGMDTQRTLTRFLTGKKVSLVPAKKDLRVYGIMADLDPKDGRCLKIFRFLYTVQTDPLSGEMIAQKEEFC